MVFLYFFLLLCAIGAMVYAYHMLRTIQRFPDSEFNPADGFLGTDLGTTLAACLVLLVVMLVLLNTGPLGPAEKIRKVTTEDQSYRTLGVNMGRELARSYLPPPKPETPEGETPAPTPEPAEDEPKATIPDSMKVLVVNYIPNDSKAHLHYQELILKGMQEGMKRAGVKTVSVETNLVTWDVLGIRQDERAIPDVPWAKLDTIVRGYEDLDAVVSLIGVPDEFYLSETRRRSANDTIKFAAITTSSYTLGPTLRAGGVDVLITPQLTTFQPGDYDDLTPDQDFRRRYLVITPHNLLDVMRDNPKIVQDRRLQE